MTLLQALVLGVVRGWTEDLPVSASGDRLLVPHPLGPPQRWLATRR